MKYNFNWEVKIIALLSMRNCDGCGKGIGTNQGHVFKYFPVMLDVHIDYDVE